MRKQGVLRKGAKNMSKRIGVSVRYFAKVPPTRTKISSDGGLDASDRGL